MKYLGSGFSSLSISNISLLFFSFMMEYNFKILLLYLVKICGNLSFHSLKTSDLKPVMKVRKISSSVRLLSQLMKSWYLVSGFLNKISSKLRYSTLIAINFFMWLNISKDLLGPNEISIINSLKYFRSP